MTTYRAKLSEAGSWILVLCALLTTVLVLRREFWQGSAITAEASVVQDWQDALAAGLRAGSKDAPVQIVEFADFECPYCAHFEATIQAIGKKYPDQVAFTFVHFPLLGHRFAEAAALVAECASAQGRFEAMRSVLFQRQQAFGVVPWTDLARQAGISDIVQFDGCLTDTRSAQRVEQHRQLGEKLGIRGTPSIIVNGWRLPATPSSDDLDKIVKNVLAGRPPATDIEFIVGTR